MEPGGFEPPSRRVYQLSLISSFAKYLLAGIYWRLVEGSNPIIHLYRVVVIHDDETE